VVVCRKNDRLGVFSKLWLPKGYPAYYVETPRLSYIKMRLKGYLAKYGTPEGYPG